MARNPGKRISAEVEADLRTLLRLMTPRQMGQAWKNALAAQCRKIRKVAVRGFRESGLRNRGKMIKAFRSSVRRDLTGFSVKITPTKRNADSCYVNRRGQRKPVVLWADTGTHNRFRTGAKKGRYSLGATPAHGFMAKARADLPRVASEMEAEVRKRAAKAAAKTIKKYYGKRD
ncbi:MAG: hypothetical protein NC342_08900 [Pseudoflavonifractor sp.]|nr:hypothetical protein [Alloprevotella sp.]MCM1117638.1 hypothetical protein [Pseudoflavonifractor sp.]